MGGGWGGVSQQLSSRQDPFRPALVGGRGFGQVATKGLDSEPLERPVVPYTRGFHKKSEGRGCQPAAFPRPSAFFCWRRSKGRDSEPFERPVAPTTEWSSCGGDGRRGVRGCGSWLSAGTRCDHPLFSLSGLFGRVFFGPPTPHPNSCYLAVIRGI